MSKNLIFTIVDNIKKFKDVNLLDNSEYENAFNSYMVLRFLSMKSEICPVLNYANVYQDVFSKQEMNKLLCEIVPTSHSFDSYIKQTQMTKQFEKEVSEYYECSIQQAREYIELMGNDWAKEISNKFGGKL